MIVDVCFLTILAAIVFSLFSGSYPLTVPDEARYIEIAREMLSSGNYITPHLDGSIFLDKPILFYWIESIIIRFLGLHAWSVRILPEFFGVLGCVFSYWGGLKLYNRRTGLLSALIQMSMFLYFVMAHYTNMDLMVAVFISCALWLFIVAVDETRANMRRIYFLAAYFFIGFGFLTKGLIGIVFPGAIAFFWMLLSGEWKILKEMCLPWGCFIVLLIITPWLFLVQKQTSFFFYYFFYNQQVFRFLSTQFHEGQPFYYYLIVIPLGVFPWVFFLLQSGFDFFKLAIANAKKNQKELFLLIWPLFILIFFSIPHSKLIGYVLPIFPPLAVMIARYLDTHWDVLPKKLSFKVVVFLWVLLCISFSSLLFYFIHKGARAISPESIVYLKISIVLFLLSALCSLYVSFYHVNAKKFFTILFLTVIFAYIVFLASFSTLRLFIPSAKSQALVIRDKMQPGDVVLSFDSYFYDLPIYTKHLVYVVSDWHVSSVINDNWHHDLGEDIIYQHYQEPYLIDQKKMYALWYSNTHVFVLVTSKNEKKLTQLIGSTPACEIKYANGIDLLSNMKGCA